MLNFRVVRFKIQYLLYILDERGIEHTYTPQA